MSYGGPGRQLRTRFLGRERELGNSEREEADEDAKDKLRLRECHIQKAGATLPDRANLRSRRSRSQKLLRRVRLQCLPTLAHSGLPISDHTCTMFKRVEKRIRKKEKEEELGLDEDMKEMLGMHADTDSDESSSDSEDNSENEGRGPVEQGDEGEGDDGSEDEEEEHDEEAQDEEESGLESDSEEEDEEPPMSVSEALQDPLYLVSLEPEVKACVVCPGKLLKNPTMIEVHLKSGVRIPPLQITTAQLRLS